MRRSRMCEAGLPFFRQGCWVAGNFKIFKQNFRMSHFSLLGMYDSFERNQCQGTDEWQTFIQSLTFCVGNSAAGRRCNLSYQRAVLFAGSTSENISPNTHGLEVQPFFFRARSHVWKAHQNISLRKKKNPEKAVFVRGCKQRAKYTVLRYFFWEDN